MAIASGTSKVEIISQVYGLLGQAFPINDLNTNAQYAAVSKMYDTMNRNLLTRTYWRFALANFYLNELQTAPVNTYWQHAYSLPPDYLILLRIYKDGQKGSFTDFQLYREQIWTNFDAPLLCDYIYNPGEAYYPAHFVELVIVTLAAKAAMTITQNINIANFWVSKAEDMFLIARSQDAMAMPNIPIQRNDIYASHFGS